VEATAALPFAMADEPLFLVHHLARLFTLGAATSLSALKEHFQEESNKPELGDVEKKLQLKVLQTLPGYLYALRLKHFLKQFYALSAQRCAEFDPADMKQLPLNARGDVSRVDWNAALPLDLPIDDRPNWLQDTTVCNALYQLFKKSAKEDEEDLPLSSSASAAAALAASSTGAPRGRGRGRGGRSRAPTLKRKRESASIGGGPATKKARKETKKAKTTKGKKRGPKWQLHDQSDGSGSDEGYDE